MAAGGSSNQGLEPSAQQPSQQQESVLAAAGSAGASSGKTRPPLLKVSSSKDLFAGEEIHFARQAGNLDIESSVVAGQRKHSTVQSGCCSRSWSGHAHLDAGRTLQSIARHKYAALLRSALAGGPKSPPVTQHSSARDVSEAQGPVICALLLSIPPLPLPPPPWALSGAARSQQLTSLAHQARQRLLRRTGSRDRRARRSMTPRTPVRARCFVVCRGRRIRCGVFG